MSSNVLFCSSVHHRIRQEHHQNSSRLSLTMLPWAIRTRDRHFSLLFTDWTINQKTLAKSLDAVYSPLPSLSVVQSKPRGRSCQAEWHEHSIGCVISAIISRYGIMTARFKAISGTHATWKSSPQRSGALVPRASRAAFPSREFLSAVILLFLDSVQQGGYANLAFELAWLQFRVSVAALKQLWGNQIRVISCVQFEACNGKSTGASRQVFTTKHHWAVSQPSSPRSYTITPYSPVPLWHTAACLPPYAGFHLLLRSLQLCWEIHWYGNTHQQHTPPPPSVLIHSHTDRMFILLASLQRPNTWRRKSSTIKSNLKECQQCTNDIQIDDAHGVWDELD